MNLWYLLLELCDGPQVRLHVGAAVLQQSDLVLDDVWIADVFQLLWVQCRQLFFWSSIDGVQRQPAGLKHRTVSREKTKYAPPVGKQNKVDLAQEEETDRTRHRNQTHAPHEI